MAIMIPSSQGGSNNRSNQSSSSDAAALEKLRIERMKKQKESAERDHAKIELQDKTRKLSFNKAQMLQHEGDLRRLQAEENQLEHQGQGAERSVKNLENDLSKERSKLTTLTSEIQKAKSNLDHVTAEFNKEKVVVEKLEHGKQATEQKSSSLQNSTSHNLDTRKRHHQTELERLKTENARLEQDIKALQMKVK